jgi:hypothetical protein
MMQPRKFLYLPVRTNFEEIHSPHAENKMIERKAPFIVLVKF